MFQPAYIMCSHYTACEIICTRWNLTEAFGLGLFGADAGGYQTLLCASVLWQWAPLSPALWIWALHKSFKQLWRSSAHQCQSESDGLWDEQPAQSGHKTHTHWLSVFEAFDTADLVLIHQVRIPGRILVSSKITTYGWNNPLKYFPPHRAFNMTERHKYCLSALRRPWKPCRTNRSNSIKTISVTLSPLGVT